MRRKMTEPMHWARAVFGHLIFSRRLSWPRITGRSAMPTRIRRSGRDRLYKGEIGVALLAAELEQPEQARMPLFEAEELRVGV